MLITGTQTASVSAEGDRPRDKGGGDGKIEKRKTEEKNKHNEIHLHSVEKKQREDGGDRQKDDEKLVKDRKRRRKDQTKGSVGLGQNTYRLSPDVTLSILILEDCNSSSIAILHCNLLGFLLLLKHQTMQS